MTKVINELNTEIFLLNGEIRFLRIPIHRNYNALIEDVSELRRFVHTENNRRQSTAWCPLPDEKGGGDEETTEDKDN